MSRLLNVIDPPVLVRECHQADSAEVRGLVFVLGELCMPIAIRHAPKNQLALVAPRELRSCRLRRHPGGRLSGGPNLVPSAIAGDRESEREYESAVLVVSSRLLADVGVDSECVPVASDDKRKQTRVSAARGKFASRDVTCP